MNLIYFLVQHTAEVNGKCGPCGDDYRKKEPRDHESQGLYGNGIIGRRYSVGQVSLHYDDQIINGYLIW